MTPMDTIKERQIEYFEILWRAFHRLGGDQGNLVPDRVHSFVLDAHASSKLVMFRGASTVPIALRHIEALLDDIREFWHQHAGQMTTGIRSVEGTALVAHFEPLHIASYLDDLAAYLVANHERI